MSVGGGETVYNAVYYAWDKKTLDLLFKYGAKEGLIREYTNQKRNKRRRNWSDRASHSRKSADSYEFYKNWNWIDNILRSETMKKKNFLIYLVLFSNVCFYWRLRLSFNLRGKHFCQRLLVNMRRVNIIPSILHQKWE